MNKYELVVLLHPDLEIDVDTPIAKLEKLIESVGGKVTKRDNWGKKRLAYRIRKVDFAIYVYFEIALAGDQVRGLENTLLITEEVLRHILVTHEVETPKPAKRVKSAPATPAESVTKAKEAV